LKRSHKSFWIAAGIALLALIAGMNVTYHYQKSIRLAKELTLRENLIRTRDVITRYCREQGRYPLNLDTLVEHQYLRDLPIDPITQRNDTWVLIHATVGTACDGPGIQDIESGATGTALDGTRYANW